MRRVSTLLALLLALSIPALAQSDWRTAVNQRLPLLGHRNWILIVDSAYPLQSSAGVETIETNASQLEVARFVLDAINHSIHVRPDILMDAELPYVPESDAPGVTAYRTHAAQLLAGMKIESLPHEQIISRIDQAGATMRVLVLKTTMTVPYTSIFLRLNCKYWSDDAEKRLREKMASGAAPGQ
jgi:RbsD / FucU transport protein family